MSTERQTRRDPLPPERFSPVAGILAIAVPGLGHLYLREVKRGLLIALGVLGLFVGGLLIGGIDVIDSQEDRIWFLGEALVGPLAFGVDQLHQTRFKAFGRDADARSHSIVWRSGYPGEQRQLDAAGRWEWDGSAAAEPEGPPNTKALGRMNELGTLFCAIAGMLNLIAFLDAFLHRPGGGLAPSGGGGPSSQAEAAEQRAEPSSEHTDDPDAEDADTPPEQRGDDG